MVHKQGWDDFARVLSPKMRGAWNLHRASARHSPDFFVLYSSIASTIGSPGQAAYATANAFLDALGEHRRALGLPATVINWGPWAAVGMAARMERPSFVRGLELLEPEAALDALGGALVGGISAATVMAVDWKTLLGQSATAAALPLLSEIRRAVGPPLAESASDHAASPLDVVTRQVALTLGLRVDEVTTDVPLEQLGLESMMGLELRERLEKAFACSVPIASLLETSVTSIAQALADAGAVLSASRETHALAVATVETAAPRDAARDSQWLVPVRTSDNPTQRLFCFPYAGGAASAYRQWAHGLPPDVDVYAIELPGHGVRRGEPMLTRVEDVVEGLIPELGRLLDRPYALFGHCLGAIVMFETARRLVLDGAPRPFELFASGAPAPELYLIPEIYTQSDERFRDVLGLINFASSEAVLADESLFQRALPFVRSGFQLASGYRMDKAGAGPLAVPITAFGGWEDVFAPVGAVQAWRAHTSEHFALHMVAGGHYFLESERAALQKVVAQKLYDARSRPAPQRLGAGSGDWLHGLGRRPDASLRLLCFPHLGGEAASFQSWAAAAPHWLEVVSIELPGRGCRSAEAPVAQLTLLAEAILGELRVLSDRPFACFGHDAGALLARETLERLGEGSLPVHLFASSAMAPHLNFFAPIHVFAEARLQELLRFFDLADLNHSARLRADFELVANYRMERVRPLPVPITAFAATADTLVPHAGIEAWSEHTSASFELQELSGTHSAWRVDPAHQHLLAMIVARLERYRGRSL
jgi:surfactin synthase thioesterase subunit